MKRLTMWTVSTLAGGLIAAGPPAASPYSNDFEKAAVGAVPDEVLVLDGPFSVQQVDRNKCLELAGDPIGSYGALFGPDGVAAMDVRARIWADASGKRFPEFGVGADDAGGYKLLLLPASHSLELRKGDDTLAVAHASWTPGTWTYFRLRVEPKGTKTWILRGKTWPQGRQEPAEWSITATDAEAPSPGKASVWGNDFSERPIRFDDLSVAPIAAPAKQ